VLSQGIKKWIVGILCYYLHLTQPRYKMHKLCISGLFHGLSNRRGSSLWVTDSGLYQRWHKGARILAIRQVEVLLSVGIDLFLVRAFSIQVALWNTVRPSAPATSTVYNAVCTLVCVCVWERQCGTTGHKTECVSERFCKRLFGHAWIKARTFFASMMNGGIMV
jgi:hypothetical protein